MDKKIVILGQGQVGKALQGIFNKEAKIFTRSDIDFSNLGNLNFNLHMMLDEINISCIINCIAYTNVDKAENEEKELAQIVNANALEILALYCENKDIPLFHFSTDFVFDGTKETFYTEEDQPNPINVYGKTKLLGEEILLNTWNKVMIFRIAWVYSIHFNHNFVAKIIYAMLNNTQISVPDDQIGNLCNVFDLSVLLVAVINKILQNINNGESIKWGIYHISPLGFESRYNIAKKILHTLKITSNNDDIKAIEVIPIATSSLNTNVQRPLNSCLGSRKFFKEFLQGMPDWCFSLHNATQKIYQKIINEK